MIGHWSLSIGYYASFLLAVNPFHIYYSQEFRSYSLLMLLGLLSMFALIKKSRWLFVLNTLLLYTHYGSILLIFSQLVYVLFFDRKLLRFAIGHLSLAIILFLPWLPRFISQLSAGSQIQSTLPGWQTVLSVSTLKAIPLVIFKFTAGRINLLPKIVYAAYIVFVFCVVSLSFLLARSKRSFLWVWFFCPLIATIVISLKLPQTQPFRLIYILPALILVLSQAVIRFPKTFITLLVYIAVTGNFLYFTRPRLQREQWRQAVAFLSNQNSTVIVKFPSKFSPLDWYSPRLPVLAAIPTLPTSPQEVSNALIPYQNSSQVFLLDYLGEITDPQNLVPQTLVNLGFSPGKTYNFEGVGFIHLYNKL